MGIQSKVLGLTGAACLLVSLTPIAGCTTDNTPATTAGTGGTVGSTTAGGSTAGTVSTGASTAGTGTSTGSSTTAGTATSGTSGGTAGTTGSTAATICANPTVIASGKPGIADFESYDGTTAVAKWSFPLGGDSANGVLAGTFAYGDRPNNTLETSEISGPGNAMSKYAFRIADSDPNRTPGANGLYGGGLGLWQSTCLDATAFSGISFWVRGNAPKKTATISIAMMETTTTMPTDTTAKPGTCNGASAVCINPKYQFPVTTDWVQIKAPWTMFTGGSAAGTPVTANGRNINQMQMDIGLDFEPTVEGGTTYAAIPAAYELVVDDIAFY